MQHFTKRWLPCFLLLCLALLFSSCKKSETEESKEPFKQTATFSADVAVDWFSFNIRMFRKNSFITNFLLSRWWQYSSVGLYEAVVPGMASYQSLSGQLNQMPQMPQIAPKQNYHWAVAANALFAAMTRYYYTNLPADDKTATDSLEAVYTARFSAETDTGTLQRSIAFGKAIAESIYQWSLTDGFLAVNPPYVPPVGPGLWVPTPPAFLPAGIPYTGNQRPLMKGSVEASQPPPPPIYSTDPASPFYAMQKELYDVSLALTTDQKEQVIFWRDQPGTGTFGHWFTIMTQVLKEQKPVSLDKAAVVYAKMGITQADTRISNWKSKYTHNMLRPVTYIRNVMGHTAWNSFIITPNNPDYPSAAASFSAASADVMTTEFGDRYQFTDRTYDFIGLPPRTYQSFKHAAEEAAVSRLHAGIHVRPATTAGLWQGSAIVSFMEKNIRFKK